MTNVYDQIGDTYDTTRSADPEIVALLADKLNLGVGHYVDIGCGTGNYTVALKEMSGIWTGLEPSTLMLDLARAKTDSIEWIQGSAESIPLPDHSLSGAISTFTIHHFTNLELALTDVDRVLKPGATLVIATATPEQTSNYWLTHYFPKMMAQDAEQLPSIKQIEACLTATSLQIADIEPFHITRETKDFFFYSGKHRPGMYLSENIRRGMSPFRMLITEEELTKGLAELERDIKNGAIEEVTAACNSVLGDYCFISITKSV